MTLNELYFYCICFIVFVIVFVFVFILYLLLFYQHRIYLMLGRLKLESL